MSCLTEFQKSDPAKVFNKNSTILLSLLSIIIIEVYKENPSQPTGIHGFYGRYYFGRQKWMIAEQKVGNGLPSAFI